MESSTSTTNESQPAPASPRPSLHVLIAGWFSFEYMGNTAGDMIACKIVGGWLQEMGISYEVAVASPFAFPDKVDLQKVDPAKFSDVVFVCGPFGNGWPVTDLLERFAHCRFSGVNLSMLQPLEEWNPFTLLLERDSTRATNPDITFIAPPPKVPVVGVILAHKQKEYGNRALHERANQLIDNLTKAREMAVVKIDTALENNQGGLRTAGEVETLIARMDVVVTTRLHGTVLALKNGVPAIAIDPIAQGAKIAMQTKAIGWPLAFAAEHATDAELLQAFEHCLSAAGREQARECARRARERVNGTKAKFIQDFRAFKK